MWPLLAVYILLICVSGGLAKPYCSWQEEEGICLETADTTSPRNASASCADEIYTKVILDVQHCFERQDANFTGCVAGTDADRCEPFLYKLQDSFFPAHAREPGRTGSLCLPKGPAVPDGEPLKGRTELLKLLTAVNVCEGRGKERAQSTKEVQLTISAPCTCSGSEAGGPFNASAAPLCSAVTVLPQAAEQCEACNNDWDTWLNDYLRRGECRPTAEAAAPIQAFCRAATTLEECMQVNANCGSQCGGTLTESPVAPTDTPVVPDNTINNPRPSSLASTVQNSRYSQSHASTAL